MAWLVVNQVVPSPLQHWEWDKMAAISHMPFSNTFSWMKSFVFYSNFIEVCQQVFNITVSQYWVQVMAPKRWWAIISTNADPVHRRIYGALGRDKLKLISPESRIYASVNWVIIASGNGLSPARRQAIWWTNAALMSIGPLETNFSEIWIAILTFGL